MDNPFANNWYVLFVLTGREHSVVNSIKAYNMEKGITNILPFIPIYEIKKLIHLSVPEPF